MGGGGGHAPMAAGFPPPQPMFQQYANGGPPAGAGSPQVAPTAQMRGGGYANNALPQAYAPQPQPSPYGSPMSAQQQRFGSAGSPHLAGGAPGSPHVPGGGGGGAFSHIAPASGAASGADVVEKARMVASQQQQIQMQRTGSFAAGQTPVPVPRRA
jgi:hypothetical protein